MSLKNGYICIADVAFKDFISEIFKGCEVQLNFDGLIKITLKISVFSRFKGWVVHTISHCVDISSKLERFGSDDWVSSYNLIKIFEDCNRERAKIFANASSGSLLLQPNLSGE